MRSLPTKKQMLKKAERLHPFRSIASWYFWRAADLPEFKKKKPTSAKKTSNPKKPLAKSNRAKKKSKRGATRT
jgi:hypothetical protein